MPCPLGLAALAEPSQATELVFPGQIICVSTTVPRSALSSPYPVRPQKPEIQQAEGVVAHSRRCCTLGPVPSMSHMHIGHRETAPCCDAQRHLACEVLVLLCFGAQQPDQPFPAGLTGLLSLIPSEFQATIFGEPPVVQQHPGTHTHAGAHLLWRWQLFQLPSAAAWVMPSAIPRGSEVPAAISRATATSAIHTRSLMTVKCKARPKPRAETKQIHPTPWCCAYP